MNWTKCQSSCTFEKNFALFTLYPSHYVHYNTQFPKSNINKITIKVNDKIKPNFDTRQKLGYWIEKE